MIFCFCFCVSFAIELKRVLLCPEAENEVEVYYIVPLIPPHAARLSLNPEEKPHFFELYISTPLFKDFMDSSANTYCIADAMDDECVLCSIQCTMIWLRKDTSIPVQWQNPT